MYHRTRPVTNIEDFGNIKRGIIGNVKIYCGLLQIFTKFAYNRIKLFLISLVFRGSGYLMIKS